MNRNNNFFLVSLFFSFFNLCSAQNQFNSIWYFGNGAGLDFSSGSVKPSTGGNVFTLEGSATVCDDNGKLLFYSDGITVWNKFHRQMKNGGGLNGNRSSTQSALIVPSLGNKGIYFLFTTDEMAGGKGLCYSVIDIAGEGSVIKKNIQILASSTEKITAVRHSNKKDVWVISHQWNSTNFLVFPVTQNGVGAPIISAIGVPHSNVSSNEKKESIGYLIASNDGRKIASAICYRTDNNFEIFDFDNTTGKISNSSTISLKGFPYGLCFSEDNSKLYISFLRGKSNILQYDMIHKSTIEIVSNEKENSFGALQLAPDGKIYVARNGNSLDVIELPNEKGNLCRYKKEAIDLSPASSNFGLPNFWMQSLKAVSEVSKKIDCHSVIELPFSADETSLTTEIAVCENTYLLNAKNTGATFRWSTGASTQQILIDTSRLYKVVITKARCSLADSIRVRFKKDMTKFWCLTEFDPESDFLNSEFYYSLDEVSSFLLKVFDKKKVHVLFETTNPDQKWNGKDLKGRFVADGEYFWQVSYKPNCPRSSKPIALEGNIVVKRKNKIKK